MKVKTHNFMFNIFSRKFGRLSDNVRRMRIACWIPKATNTHSQYVIPKATNTNSQYVIPKATNTHSQYVIPKDTNTHSQYVILKATNTHSQYVIPKATNTHSQYIILTAFPPQQWLYEAPLTLRSTYIACLVHYTCHIFAAFSQHSSWPSQLTSLQRHSLRTRLIHRLLERDWRSVLSFWTSASIQTFFYSCFRICYGFDLCCFM